jgi:hypothetical protein
MGRRASINCCCSCAAAAARAALRAALAWSRAIAGRTSAAVQAAPGRPQTHGCQLLPQLIAPGRSAQQILAVAALQGLELGNALLQHSQALGVALQALP